MMQAAVASVPMPTGWPLVDRVEDMMEMDRETFVRRLRAGDQDAIAQALEEVLPAARRLLRTGFSFRSGEQMLRFNGGLDPFDEDDLLQTAVEKAFGPRGLASYDGLRPLQPWFLQILRHCVIDEFRRTRRSRLVLVEEGKLADMSDPKGEDAVEGGIDAEALAAVIDAFRRGLPEPDGTVLRKRFDEGLSQRDCARVLGLSRAQIRTIEQRLRRRLGGVLRERGLWMDDV